MKYDVIVNVSGIITIDADSKEDAMREVERKGLWVYGENLDDVELLQIADACAH